MDGNRSATASVAASGRWLRASLRPSAAALLLIAAITVPFVVLGEERALALTQQLVDGAGSALAAALVAVLALDVVLPVPSSWVATLSGGALGFWAGLVVNWLGLNLGCALGYVLGRRVGHAGARRMLGAAQLERIAASFERYGAWSIPLLRAVPVLAEASVITAGCLRLSPARFWAASLSANLGVAAVYAWAGAMALRGASWLWVFLGATLLPGGLWLLAQLGRLRSRS